MTAHGMTAHGPQYLVVDDLTVHRPDGQLLLRSARLALAPAELVLLIGPSGCGKSTLMLLLGGLLPRGGGGWQVSGRMSCQGASQDLARRQPGMGGVVFQDHALFDDLDAGENLQIASDHGPADNADLAVRITPLLGGIDPGQAVGSCSGGQRQRLAIARTVLADQPVLLFDEPNSGLDVVSARRLIGLVRAMCRELGKPALITVHHYQDLLPLADRVLLLDPNQATLREIACEASLVEAALTAAARPDTLAPAPGGPVPLAVTAGNPVAPPAPAMFAPVPAPEPLPALAHAQWQLGRRPARHGLWFGRYLAGYAWLLCASPEMLLYLAGGAVIVGFVTVWFGFSYYSFEGYLKSLLHDDTLIGLGMVQFRIAIPLLASILFVSRNSAVIAADVGNRVLSSQFRAMDNLNIPGRFYIYGTILISMTLGCVFFVLLSLLLGGWAARETWHIQFPTQYRGLFEAQFYREVLDERGWPLAAMAWVPVKAAASGLVAGLVSLLVAARQKSSSQEVGRAVANAIVLGVLLTLVVHAAISLLIP